MPRLNSKRDIGGQIFILAERIKDYRSAALAQAEYWAEGYCCRREVVDTSKDPHYNIWVGPPRLRQVRLLPGEHITRQKTTRVLGVA
jgi:hypothetical protein